MQRGGKGIPIFTVFLKPNRNPGSLYWAAGRGIQNSTLDGSSRREHKVRLPPVFSNAYILKEVEMEGRRRFNAEKSKNLRYGKRVKSRGAGLRGTPLEEIRKLIFPLLFPLGKKNGPKKAALHFHPGERHPLLIADVPADFALLPFLAGLGFLVLCILKEWRKHTPCFMSGKKKCECKDDVW
jgi:hypothetical protein